MEANCGAIPKALVRTSRLANRQHLGSLCDALVFDVSEPGGILVADAATCRPRRRVSGAGVHHLSRLRARIIFQIGGSQSYPRCDHRGVDVHAVLSLAMGTRHPSL